MSRQKTLVHQSSYSVGTRPLFQMVGKLSITDKTNPEILSIIYDECKPHTIRINKNYVNY